MTTPDSYHVLRKSDSGGLILAADFAATGRTTATFHDLVDLLEADHTIWETAPLPYGTEPGKTGTDQVDRWERDVRDSGLPVHAVIGFCGGGVYAAALTERVAAWQDAPRLILLDPGIVKRTMLVEHVEGLLRRLGGTFTPQLLAEATAALRTADETAADPLQLAANLAAWCNDVIVPGLRRAFHSAQASTDFVQLIVGYLHWLGGAATLDPRARWRTATALNSASLNFGLHLASPEERPTLVGSATYYDVQHGDLMRTPEIGQAVDALLA
ncbi:hypothetical protein [Dactylosporangium matsuzakiense]|uniref:Thioesterase domain-containing protein n=1 Tax=Dactylosporangium matsuzakiense TaxID=53360 RepID=A0A9W6KRR8_9ACTN|nr:hypothetical protein [Dactylosporangium matsuzakiense]UWZ42325.1 hypothetical protein Dmats_32795 [Dactylosporangium matsuzakiense]GLL05301.1 hypothetical protein GCM10017581_070480 [Dactylosporangium matsuzakiense]